MAPVRPADCSSGRRSARICAAGVVINNPHNQTLNVAVQWGAVGIVVLYAMWLFHLLLFRGEGLVAWIGLMVVVQNIFTSLFNSHIFDFHEGWMYVLGVGVAGGMTLRARQDALATEAAGGAMTADHRADACADRSFQARHRPPWSGQSPRPIRCPRTIRCRARYRLHVYSISIWSRFWLLSCCPCRPAALPSAWCCGLSR